MAVARTPSATARFPALGSTHPRVLFVGSHPPRECGIATFCDDVRIAYDRLTRGSSPVIAIDEPSARRSYPPCVIGRIASNDVDSYVAAARVVNETDVDVVNVQHEYGLFGGERGEMLMEMLRRVRRPVVVTLHTTRPDPDHATLRVTRDLCRRADRVMVLTHASKEILADRYDVDPSRICVVMHGVPDVHPYHGGYFKRRFGLRAHTVLSTFGLLSRGKGIETIIEAMPDVVARHPDAVYVLWGATHPEVKRTEGERYRQDLRARAQRLGVADRIRFFDRYMTDDEVVSVLLATDIYVSPSLDPHQSVSGTLSYALACGRAIVATEYVYARELLAEGRGITVPFRDPAAVAAAVTRVLDDPRQRSAMEAAAYRFGRQMTWPNIAAGYRNAFRTSIFAGLEFAPAAIGA